MPKINIDVVWSNEAAIYKKCPLGYCIFDRYPEGSECLYLYTATNGDRLRLIEKYLDQPIRIDELARLTGIHKIVLNKLSRSDILIGDVSGGGTGRHLIIKAVNWPAGMGI